MVSEHLAREMWPGRRILDGGHAVSSTPLAEPGGAAADYGREPRMPVLFLLIAVALSLALPGGQARAPSARYVLTSVEQNIDAGNWQITARETGVAPDVPWSVRRQRLHGGKQEGVDLIVIDNGRMQITIVPTRGMGILHVVMGDLRLGWDSPVREVVHPKYINLEARGGLGWLEGFNEWLARCGLEWAGHPGPDRFVNNVGEPAEMNLTLHGKVANIPASEVEVIVEREPRARIRVRGRVDERAFYGPKLELWTEVWTEPGSATFRIEDALTNRGAFEQEFQLIYHVNHGPPLLGPGARFSAAVGRVTPFNAHAAKDVDDLRRLWRADARLHRAGLQPASAGRCRGRAMLMLRNGAATAPCRWVRGRGAPLRDTLEEPDGDRRGICHGPRARHRVPVYAAARTGGRASPEAEAG